MAKRSGGESQQPVFVVVQDEAYEATVLYGGWTDLDDAKEQLVGLLTGPKGAFPKRGINFDDWEIREFQGPSHESNHEVDRHREWRRK